MVSHDGVGVGGKGKEWCHSLYHHQTPPQRSGVVYPAYIVLPYWEFACTLAAKNVYIFVGFEKMCVGMSMNAREADGSLYQFVVGDTIGIGLDSDRRLFFAKNGELLAKTDFIVGKETDTDVPIIKLRGGIARFKVNFGEDGPFSFNPFAVWKPNGGNQVLAPPTHADKVQRKIKVSDK